jgi:hypothetical protein
MKGDCVKPPGLLKGDFYLRPIIVREVSILLSWSDHEQEHGAIPMARGYQNKKVNVSIETVHDPALAQNRCFGL